MYEGKMNASAAEIVEPKPRKQYRTKEQHIAYAIMRQEGMSPGKAAKAVGLHPATGYRLEEKRDIYEASKGRLLKDSVKSLAKLVKGEPVGTVDRVKDSTVLAACQVVLDREKPKVHLAQTINVNLDFLPIELTDYC
jgi:predicted urease superfamily metal-dependent hydrolase